MILIWKPPALLIVFFSTVACFASLLWFDSIFNFNDRGHSVDYLYLVVNGTVVMIADLVYRKRSFIDYFDLDASTLFFVVPTWVFGALVMLFSAGMYIYNYVI